MAEEATKQGCKGGVFWHSQDDDSFKEYGSLMIGFVGSVDEVKSRLTKRFDDPLHECFPNENELHKFCENELDKVAVEVAKEAVAEFERQGLKVKWDGTVAHRIEVTG